MAKPDPKDLNPGGTFLDELKKLVEAMRPDVRHYFKPSLQGRVVKVHDDENEETYYRCDVVIGGDEDGSGGLALPDVPVQSAWAQNGYGVFARPEEGAEVMVSFEDGDVTRPYIESPIYVNNRAPGGFRAGTFAIRGKNGQKIELKADSNEIIIASGSLKVISSLKRQDLSDGDESREVAGNLESSVTGKAEYEFSDVKIKAARSASLTADKISVETAGSYSENIGTAKETVITGNEKKVVGGGLNEAVAGNKKNVIGGALNIIIGNSSGTPAQTALSITAASGIVSIDTLAGMILLGGPAATGQLAIHGPSLIAFLDTLLGTLQSSFGISAVGDVVTLGPNAIPVVAGLRASLASLLSTKVNIGK